MRNHKEPEAYDLIGVGFGPSNLALAIALEEKNNGRSPNALFLDRQSNYRWHGNTITDQSDLQISFLKDLVSQRDPTSPYSFINYLHQHGRLVDFINLGTFYPSRLEFDDYLRWVARHFSHQCRYGEEVLSVEPVKEQRSVKALRVLSRDHGGREWTRESRSLVIGAGGTPRIPAVFRDYIGDERIFHHAQYLTAMKQQSFSSGRPVRVAVVGGGQSAAEAFIDLHDSYPSAQVDLIVRNFSIKPADSSPFVNEIFAPFATDLVYQQTPVERDRFLKEYKHANYSAVDMSMIEKIYGIFYRQKVCGEARHRFRGSSLIETVNSTEQGVGLVIRDAYTGETDASEYDVVILATGYERRMHHEILAPVAEYMGDFEVDRYYRVQTDERFQVPVYLQGYCEPSHGISDTLLSVLAVRTDEIAASLYASIEGMGDVEETDKLPDMDMVES